MRKWNVLMTTADYVEVEADTHVAAELAAFALYKSGEIRPEHPIFVCEKADEITEDDDA